MGREMKVIEIMSKFATLALLIAKLFNLIQLNWIGVFSPVIAYFILSVIVFSKSIGRETRTVLDEIRKNESIYSPKDFRYHFYFKKNEEKEIKKLKGEQWKKIKELEVSGSTGVLIVIKRH